jgi:membrane glycosyltransferase
MDIQMDLLRLAQTGVMASLPAPAASETPDLLPEQARLAMPRQSFDTGTLAADKPASSPADIGLRRAMIFGATAIISGAGIAIIADALSWHGWQPLEVVFFGLFSFLFSWMTFSFLSYGIGLWVLSSQGDDLGLTTEAPVPLLRQRTAILMPICNEDALGVAERLRTIRQSLISTRQGRQFDIFILSDTQNAENAKVERFAFHNLLRRQDDVNVYYRRRTLNTDRKAGNIADWVQSFGAAYPHMVVLDADSLMSGDTLVRLAGAMERHPGIGLIQTAPRLINQTSLFARCEQFAARLYGPAAACGTAWWSGSESNYWGHNAIIRTRAFAEAAGLPHLKGPAPFGGHIMSHDFVEAGLLRRAGWAVHMAPRLEGSYEESPPTLIDALQRDRRWCQGNIQHAAIVGAAGLHWVNRFHLARGVLNYLIAPIWVAMLAAGAALAATNASFNVTGGLTVMLFVTFAFLLLPKGLATLHMLTRTGERHGFGGALATLTSLIVETVISTLLTPIVMLSHTAMVISVAMGRKSGWKSQRRSGYAVDVRELAYVFLPHTLIGVALAVAISVLIPETALSLSVVTLSLILSGPLVALTAQTTPKGLTDLFRIPEESRTALSPLKPVWKIRTFAWNALLHVASLLPLAVLVEAIGKKSPSQAE